MADNVVIPATGTSGTANPTIATDDVTGVQYQKVKLDVGGDGLSVPVVGTVPVSGTITANAGTGPFPVSDNAGSLTVDAPVATPVATRLSDGTAFLTTTAGRLAVDGSGVTQPISGTVTANAGTGTFTVAGTVTANAGTGTFTTADNQVVTDNAAFTDGTTKVFMGGFVFDEVAGTALTENDAAAARIDSKRAQVLVLEDGTTRGQRAAVSAAGRVSVDASGVAVPVTDNGGSLTVDGTVGVSGTVTVDTELNTTDLDTGAGTETQAAVGILIGAAGGSSPLSTSNAMPVKDNGGSLTVDAPVGTPVFARLSDGTAALTTTGGRLSVDASGVAVPVTDNAGSLTVDAPVGTPVFTRLSDGTAALTTTGGRLAVDPSGVTSPVSIAAAVSTKYDVVTAATAAWTSATALDTTASIATAGYGTVLVSLNPTSTFTAGGIIFEVSDDAGTTWYPIQGIRADSFTAEGSYTIVASTKRIWQFSVAGATNFRVRLNPVITGTGTANLRVQASAASVEPGVTVGGTVTANAGTGTFTVAGTVTANAGTGNFTVVNGGTFAVQDSQVVTDNAAFTDGTTKLFMAGYILDDTAGTALTENDAAAPRISTNRAVVNVIEDGATRARYATVTAANALKVDASATTQPVSVAAAVTMTEQTAGGKTPAFAVINAAAAGANAIVAADATRKIKVVSYVLVADAAVTAKWQSATTDLSGAMSLAANGGVSAIGSFDAHILETAVNQALNLNLGTATGVRGHISYFLET